MRNLQIKIKERVALDMKKSKLRKILIIIIVLNLILLVSFLIYNNINKNVDSNTNTQEVDKERDSSEYVRPELVYPMSVSEFSEKYTGTISDEYILEKLTNLIYYITDNKETIDSLENNQINSKYNQNKELLNNMGIENEESFRNLVSKVKQIPSNEIEYSYSEFIVETSKDLGDNFSIDLNIKFVNYDPITFNVKISNKYEKDKILVSIN